MSGKKLLIVIIASVAAVILLSAAGSFLKSKNNTTPQKATFPVKRGPLRISFIESGTIKANEQIIIKNEVEGRRSIITLIPEGTRVKKGDLLVELDASSLQDDKIDQEIKVQNAEASFIGAKENFAVIENQAKSDVDLAQLTLDFAKQDLQKYLDGEYPYELDQAEAEITLAEEELARAEQTSKWSKQLYKEKYISQTELQADELAEKKKTLDVELAKKSKQLLTEYTFKRQLAQLKSDVSQAEMALERTQRKARADVIQAKAELKAKQAEYNRQKDKLAKIEDQISKTKIYAPHQGLAIYATSAKGGWRGNEEPLDEGQEVRERQELIYLPKGNDYKAEINIHETNLKKTSLALPAIIKVDALTGKTFYGNIQKIAPLPDPTSMWMNPDLKVYNSEILLENPGDSLRTGMSCQAEIIVQNLEDALYVPMQAVVKIGSQPSVFVYEKGQFSPKPVTLGLDNNNMVHIKQGLTEGQLVMLNPPLSSASITEQGQSAPNSDQNNLSIDNQLKQKISRDIKNAAIKAAAKSSPQTDNPHNRKHP